MLIFLCRKLKGDVEENNALLIAKEQSRHEFAVSRGDIRQIYDDEVALGTVYDDHTTGSVR